MYVYLCSNSICIGILVYTSVLDDVYMSCMLRTILKLVAHLKTVGATKRSFNVGLAGFSALRSHSGIIYVLCRVCTCILIKRTKNVCILTKRY